MTEPGIPPFFLPDLAVTSSHDLRVGVALIAVVLAHRDGEEATTEMLRRIADRLQGKPRRVA